MHEVYVLCNCPDVEQCRTELYVSDVRIATAEVDRLRRGLSEMVRLLRQQSRALRTFSEWVW